MLILLPPELARRLADLLADAGPNEIGGILMGEQLSPGTFRMVDFSVDAAGVERDRFLRDMDRHAEALRAFFERTGSDFERFNYLGEWHSHPCFPVAPSSKDVRSMQEMVNGDEGIPFAALLILKLGRRERLRASATLFQFGQFPRPIVLRREIGRDPQT